MNEIAVLLLMKVANDGEPVVSYKGKESNSNVVFVALHHWQFLLRFQYGPNLLYFSFLLHWSGPTAIAHVW